MHKVSPFIILDDAKIKICQNEHIYCRMGKKKIFV